MQVAHARIYHRVPHAKRSSTCPFSRFLLAVCHSSRSLRQRSVHKLSSSSFRVSLTSEVHEVFAALLRTVAENVVTDTHTDRHTDRHTDPSTVTLAVHAHRGLTTTLQGKVSVISPVESPTFPSDSTPTGSWPDGVNPFSARTSSLSSLQGIIHRALHYCCKGRFRQLVFY